METALTALLAGDARVKLLAGNKVHWVRAPQRTATPYAVLQVISSRDDYHMQGPSGLTDARVQIDAYAESYLAAKRLSDAILGVLSGYRGTVSGIRLQGGFVENRRDFPASASGDVTPLFRRSADIIIWHSL
ncbi:hypothetical protein SFHH103_01657 [Sinorhizobium fredii HH103]|uniref:DUF3168 domain-containing protein n=1 Tax=Sinorhizobium fredii (strain HH103) TaxID=1117943 RepID=G9A7C4_SINF1|nr:DUF3168 domain-containing protein [Sinorhizobium fredii]CCE96154.1 hypothetical protein SFHH103_01657 [Sinorhizobium fredii HH103]